MDDHDADDRVLLWRDTRKIVKIRCRIAQMAFKLHVCELI